MYIPEKPKKKKNLMQNTKKKSIKIGAEKGNKLTKEITYTCVGFFFFLYYRSSVKQNVQLAITTPPLFFPFSFFLCTFGFGLVIGSRYTHYPFWQTKIKFKPPTPLLHPHDGCFTDPITHRVNTERVLIPSRGNTIFSIKIAKFTARAIAISTNPER